MPLFEYKDNEALGCVISVDTATVTIRVDDIERLRRIQVNRLTVLQSSKAGQHLIGVVTRSRDEPTSAAIVEGETLCLTAVTGK